MRRRAGLSGRSVISVLAVLILLLAVSGVLSAVTLYLGVTRLLRADAEASSSAMRVPRVADLAEALRLPRFAPAFSLASDPDAAWPPMHQRVGDITYTLSDAGGDRLEILAEYSSERASLDVLPIRVVTSEREDDYLLIFRAEDSGRWVAVLEIHGLGDWADVFIRDLRERTALNADDAATVARSVRAVGDPWVPEWQRVAGARAEEDPVRKAIEQALRA